MTASDDKKILRCEVCGRKQTTATHLYEEEREGRTVCLCKTCFSISENRNERKNRKTDSRQ